MCLVQPNLAKLTKSEFCRNVTSTGNRSSAGYDVSTSVFNCVNVCRGYTSPAYYKNDIHPQKGLMNFKISAERDCSYTYSVEYKCRRCRLWEKWRVLILPLTHVQTLKITSFVTVGIICNFPSVSEHSPLPNTCATWLREYQSGNGIIQNHPKPTSANFACTRASMCIHDPWSVCTREFRVLSTRETLIRVTPNLKPKNAGIARSSINSKGEKGETNVRTLADER